MPPVVAAVSVWWAGITVASVVAFVAKVAVFMVISRALAPKQKNNGGAEVAQDRSLVVRSTTEPHRIIYGRSIVSGLLAYFETTGATKEFAHMVIILAGHEVDSIGRVWFDDTEVGTLDGSGNVTSGRYAGLARIIKALGSDTQVADATLIAESGGAWTANDRLRGRAYIYVRIKRDDTAFPSGLPNVRAEVKGRKVLDPRDGVTRWTMNPALIERDVLTASWGLGALSAEIDDATVIASANVDDERVAVSTYASSAITADSSTDRLTFATAEVRFGIGDGVTIASTLTLPTGFTGGTTYYVIRISDRVVQLATTYANALAGTAINFTTNGTGVITLTHVDQVRYTCNGTFTRDTDPKEMLEAIALCHVGPAPIFREGQWRVYAGAWVTPTVTLTETDLRGDVTEQIRPPRQSLFNAVRGTYAPAYNSTNTEYPPVTNSTYETQDGSARIFRDLNFAMVDNSVRAQRLAKLALELGRSASTIVLPCKLSALKIATWDTVYVTLATMGMTAATYRVKGWKLTAEDGALGVDLTLQEEAASIYGWTAGSATAPSVPPDLSIPSPNVIGPPTSLVLTSGTAELLKTTDGTIISRIKVSFTGAVETNLWRYELQWKKSSESTYNTVYMPSDSTVYYLAPVEDGVLYNVQVRSHAVLGPRSAWLTGTHTVTGKTAAPAAPTSIAVTGTSGGFDLLWSVSTDVDYYATQIWEATTNDRATATQIAEVSSTRMTRSGLAGGLTRYYWVRHVDTTGNVSSYYPFSATGGAGGTTASAGNTQQITHDTTSFLAGGATAYLTGNGYWLGYNSTAYKLHLGNPATSYIAWDGTTFTVKGSIMTGDVQVDTAGNIRGGQTAYATGTGFWIGYNAGAYKFSIGSASAYMRWDGANLTMTGQVVDTRQHGAGSNVFVAAPFPLYVPISASVMTLCKSIRISRPGTITVYFEAKSGPQATCFAQIYKNSVAAGTLRTLPSGTPGVWGALTSYSENITVAAGDLVQLYARSSTLNYSLVKNFRLKTNLTISQDGVEADDAGVGYAWAEP